MSLPPNFNVATTEESAFVHHRKKMSVLKWKKQPSSVSLFVQPQLSVQVSDTIQKMKEFLLSWKLQITEQAYNGEDFIILVGSDGYNLEISNIFPSGPTPPIVSFAPIKEGFISFMPLSSYEIVIPQIIRGNCWLMPRCRLSVTYESNKKDSKNRVVLNDVAINRAPQSGSLKINCFSCGVEFSHFIGDGVIIATPTGSTAYNKAAGGALVHPLLPVFLLTPICALSLSARPILFPQSADLTISLGSAKENHFQDQGAFLTFDGTDHTEFKIGEKIMISISPYNYNTIMMTKSIAEWPVRLARLMSWNERKGQKPLPKKNDKSDTNSSPS